MNNKKGFKVKAKFSYTRQNEDELSFTKGNIFTITKKEEGGWWEGNFNGKIGWFPSNYVKEIKVTKNKSIDGRISPSTQKGAQNDEVDSKVKENKEAYYQQVLKNLIETEHSYVKELETLVREYLQPLQPQTTSGSDGIPASDIRLLNANLPALLEFQVKFLQELEDVAKKPLNQQTIGLCFIQNGDTLRTIYEEYCSNHPSIVIVLQTHKEYLSSYMENKGVPASGIVHLTSSLSLPFRHLEHYPSQLRELERHMLENHPDANDLARAISQYETYFIICQETRKRKETVQHILTSSISGWVGDPISALGPVVFMSSARFYSGSIDEKKERFLLLFPSALLILSASPRMSGFVYEGKLPLTAVRSKKLEDTSNYQHAFEIIGNLIDRKVIITRSADEQRRWLQVLATQSEQCRRTSVAQVASPSPIVKQVPVTQIPPAPKHTGTPNQLPQTVRKTPELLQHISPTVSPPPPFPIARNAANMTTNDRKPFNLILRPAPPSKQYQIHGKESTSSAERSRSPKPNSRRTKRRNNKIDRKTIDEDSVLPDKSILDIARLEEEQKVLDVLKYYCNAMLQKNVSKSYNSQTKNRQTSILDEKIIMEDPENDTLIEEKSLVDAVYGLKDQVATLIQDQKRFQKSLEEETKARKKLEHIIRRAAKGENIQKGSTLPSYSSSSSNRKNSTSQ